MRHHRGGYRLTLTLRRLKRDGMVRRTVHPVVPPRVEYALTPLGRTLHEAVRSLVVWTGNSRHAIAAARTAYDRAAAAAADTDAVPRGAPATPAPGSP
ncbi:winged helix-turn-helix transcriptional regulator [Streptomyces sp. NPDC059853]|uniref:winged helix-turn-helix transcriptional regulator n=1 Tax=Streptomyces sp. NPDC059853 TaxID=3346973 RepID=UPI0036631EE3